MENLHHLIGIIFTLILPLSAQKGYHPAQIVKKEGGNSFVREEAYISFGGCGANNKSLFDELPLIISRLSVLEEGLAKVQRENFLLKTQLSKLIIGGKLNT